MRQPRHILLTTIVFIQTASVASAQYAWFARNTDTISVGGQTILGDACTIEAVFMLPGSHHSGGSIFDEWVLQQEEKYLSVSFQTIGGVAFPNDYLEVTEQRSLISLDQWHHVAFVCNGSEARIYLDGVRIQSRPASSPIGNGPGQAAIGYAPRDGSDFPSFIGFLDSIRVSGNARYSGLSFPPPAGDLAPDADTLLLYNFNDAPGSATVADESALDRTGVLGTGFPGATAPKLIAELPEAAPLALEIFTAVELQFLSSLNVQYQLQSSPDMAVWTDLPEFIKGDGGIMTKLLPTRGNSKLFYRVVSRP